VKKTLSEKSARGKHTLESVFEGPGQTITLHGGRFLDGLVKLYMEYNERNLQSVIATRQSRIIIMHDLPNNKQKIKKYNTDGHGEYISRYKYHMIPSPRILIHTIIIAE